MKQVVVLCVWACCVFAAQALEVVSTTSERARERARERKPGIPCHLAMDELMSMR